MSVEHVAYQRSYFDRDAAGKVRLEPVESAYVQRHFLRTWATLRLPRASHVVEVGAGLGRFTRYVRERASVTATDLSPDLLAQLRGTLADVPTVACDIADLHRHVRDQDGALGFFMLHHLDDLERAFAGVRGALKTGGRVAFCEPNAYCPLYYAQIAFSRHMTMAGDGGVVRMRPGLLTKALARAGFGDVAIERYGFTPPAIYNHALGARLDRSLEAIGPLRPFRAFQIVSATAC